MRPKDNFPLTNKVSESAARQIVKQIAQALDYLHGNGICHNDIRPSHIMITRYPWNADDERLSTNMMRSSIYKVLRVRWLEWFFFIVFRQRLMAEHCSELIFKLIDFSRAFYFTEGAVYNQSSYLPKTIVQEERLSMANRDIHGLAMTAIHAVWFFY